ncbi:DNA polymerase III subunit delta [Chloroflexota bacterium]
MVKEKHALLYLLTGQDDFSISESLENLKKGIVDPTLADANTTVLEGRQITLDQLRPIVETVPFMAEKRLVIIRGLLERFEPKRKSGRQRKTKKASERQDSSKSLGVYLGQIPDSTVLILIDLEISGNNPLLKELSGKIKISSFPLLKGDRLRQWIDKRVVAESGSISPQAAGLLMKLVGSNLWIMASEISKLVLFASGRRIEEEDVNSLVSYAQQTNVFAMVDAILESKAGVAEQMLQWLLQRGAASTYILAILARQVQLIVRSKGMRSQNKSNMEIQNKLGITADFAFHKILEQSDRYSLPRMRKVYAQLLEADLAIKTGKYDGEFALNILIAELCQS